MRRGDVPAQIKVAFEDEERRGAELMVWWGGEGSARVLAHEGNALLMERAAGAASLVEMVRQGRDDDASRIICDVTARLHAARTPSGPVLVPLTSWFRELEFAALRYGGVLGRAAVVARELLKDPQRATVLHGDVHHASILDFGARGWLAVDPKGLLGEKGFDFANIFCNPDLETVVVPGRLARQASIVAEAAGLDYSRLLRWILAYAGLSAAWTLGENEQPVLALHVAEIAYAELASSKLHREALGCWVPLSPDCGCGKCRVTIALR